jgi:holliday junction DNA helicase RuvA
MIALLTGTPLISADSLIVVVHDVGYAVSVSNKTLQLASTKEVLTLHIHTHVREETLELFGFSTAQDKQLFLLLLTVSGVGPRTALAISDRGAQGITTAVQEADLKFFSTVPRVGKKLAQKIIIELTSKLGTLRELDLQPLNTFESELASALTALGFAEQEIGEIVRDENISGLSIEVALQYILKKVGKKIRS